MTARAERDPMKLPSGIFLQDKVWLDHKNILWNLEDIPNGHLQNLIAWLERNDTKITQLIKARVKPQRYGVRMSPLYKALKRVDASRTQTPEEVLNSIVENQALADQLIDLLRDRGYTIKPLTPGDH